MSGKLQGKVALITGGAGGLGLGISLAFSAAGAKVALVGRDEEKLAAGKAEVEGADGECVALVADMSTAAGAAEAIAAAEQRLGPIDVVVNSAGVFIWKKFLDLEPADWEGTLKSNLSAAFYTTQAFARTTAEKERQGAVINISSIHGVVGDGGVVPHCASKFGLLGLTEASAEALRPMGIRVNCISPGSIEPESAGKTSETLKDKVTQGELASLAIFLASDESGNLTGVNLNAFGITRPVIASK